MIGNVATALAGAAAATGALRWVVRRRAKARRQRRRLTRAPNAAATSCVRLDYPKAAIWMYVTSEIERKHRAHNCRKEPWTVQWLERHLTPGDVMYDVGANVGAFSLVAAVARGASVVAFEPGYANYARLCENLALNSCHDRVLTVPLALSDSNRDVQFHYRGVEPGQSRHRIQVGGVSETESRPHHMCAIRLDDARLMLNLPPPTHLKIDVDGWELHVLEGALETMRCPELRSILIEVDAPLWDEVTSVLGQSGFECLEQFARGKGPVYGIFLRRKPGGQREPVGTPLLSAGV